MRLRKGKLISEWKDDYENRALIEEVDTIPYKGAKQGKSYRLSCFAEYDNDFCYYISIFDSVASAEQQLKEISCGTFKDVLIVKAENIIHRLEVDYKIFIFSYMHDIKKIKNCKETSKEEKMALIDTTLNLYRMYINFLANYSIIGYDEAKILYAYMKKQ